MANESDRKQPSVEELSFVIAQLRHLYANLWGTPGLEGPPKDASAAKRMAEGLVAPQIRRLESLSTAIQHVTEELTQAKEQNKELVDECHGHQLDIENLREDRDRLKEALTKATDRLRMEWWLGHGCSLHMLYGDDGEMQCNAATCMRDFRREPIESLQQHVEARRMAVASAALSQVAPLRDCARQDCCNGRLCDGSCGDPGK